MIHAATPLVLSPQERLQSLQTVVADALDVFEPADPYRLALAATLALVPVPVAARWCRARPPAVERVIRAHAARLGTSPGALPSPRDVVAVRHAALHAAMR